MNVKEIATAVGKDERTVRRWVQRASDKMSEVADKMSEATPTYPADFDLEETIAIIEIGLGKNAAGMYRVNAGNIASTVTENVPGLLTPKDMQLISMIVSQTVAETMTRVTASIDRRMTDLEDKFQQRQALLPAPQISDRDNLNMIIREYAARTGTPYGEVWGMLYHHTYHRLKINFKVRAEKLGVPTIDYMDSEGHLPQVLAIAMEIFKDNKNIPRLQLVPTS